VFLNFAQPLWLLLIPAAACLEWAWPRFGLRRPLRAACVILAALALADLRFVRQVEDLDLIVLADRSDSAELSVDPNLREWLTLLQQHQGPRDRLRVIDFARNPVERQTLSDTRTEIATDGSRIGLAVEYALSQVDPNRPTRLLLFSDGYGTDDVQGLSQRLTGASVPLDLRLAIPPQADDLRISRFEAPSSVLPGEAAVLDVEVSGNYDDEATIEIRRNGALVGQETLQVRNGTGRLRLRERIREAGAHQYQARLIPNRADAYAGNNVAQSWTEVEGGPRLLLITSFTEDPVAEALRATGMEVTVRQPQDSLHAGMLNGVRAILLNNVPANELPPGFLDAVEFTVREQGAGFVMFGGRYSFGTGGYFESPIDQLLPVSMELKEEQRKLSLAMAVVMDRSGSMSAGVGAGKTKMDLANEGTVRAIELLGSKDELAAYAVDSEAHEIFPLLPVEPNREMMTRVAGAVQSMGGGIYVYNGLEAGWNALQQSVSGTRHLILFSDAADSEQPDAYKALLNNIRANNGTVSVIALGTEQDADAEFLKDIADRGEGRIFFTTEPGNLPNIFAQETVSVARSAFITDPVGTELLPGALELVESQLPFPKRVPAYNLCYLRADATLAARTTDEDASPLLAFWQRGAGRVAALTAAVGGEEAAAFRQWEGFSPLVQTITRWVAAPDLPPGMMVRTTREGDVARLELFYDPDEPQAFLREPPRIVTQIGDTTREQIWERLAPGHYQAVLDLPAEQPLRGAIQTADSTIGFGPIMSSADEEWQFDPTKINAIRAESAASGGRRLVDFAKAWEAPPNESLVSFREWLVLILLLTLIADVFATRWFGEKGS